MARVEASQQGQWSGQRRVMRNSGRDADVDGSAILVKAAVNAPQSRRLAKFEDARQSRSVWSARAFSTALLMLQFVTKQKKEQLPRCNAANSISWPGLIPKTGASGSLLIAEFTSCLRHIVLPKQPQVYH